MKKMHVPSVIAGPVVESARRQCGRSQGFTLIELLVVISIIALLIGILLPTLGRAREEANAIKCAASARSIGQAVANYTASSKDYYPVSYAYLDAASTSTTWNMADQIIGGSTGKIYYHWSYALVGGSAAAASFTCPSMNNGGMPRTNPGSKAANWEPGQSGGKGIGGSQDSPVSKQDLQVERVAFGMNAFVVPRNKLHDDGSGTRRDVFVKAGMIRAGSSTILAAEYVNNYRQLMDADSIVKSHRPITPLPDKDTGYSYYQSSSMDLVANYKAFASGDASIASDHAVNQAASSGEITDQSGPTINAVARHHRGGKSAKGGGSVVTNAMLGAGNNGGGNMLFVDGHVSRMTILKTLEDKLWGDRVYSISGSIVEAKEAY